MMSARPDAKPVTTFERALGLQNNDVGVQPAVGYAHAGERHWQRESARARTPRVEKQNVVTRFDRRLMRVTINHRGEAGCRRIEVELSDIMQKIEFVFADRDDRGGRETRRPMARIDVAANRKRRRDTGELFDQTGCSDVACVNDQIGTGEFRERPRPQQAMRVRDDADDDVIVIHPRVTLRAEH
jgi:hypothetical protein